MADEQSDQMLRRRPSAISCAISREITSTSKALLTSTSISTLIERSPRLVCKTIAPPATTVPELRRREGREWVLVHDPSVYME
jgi:hypothetical protein